MEPFAKQPAPVRPRAVIVGWKRPACFVSGPDMAEISLFRGIAEKGAAFLVGFGLGRVEHDLAAACRREPIRPDSPAGEIVGGKFPDRQPSGKISGKRVCRVMVLVPAFEGRNPQRPSAAAGDRPVEVGCRRVEIKPQPARRCFAEEDRLQPEKRRRGQRLVSPATHPSVVSAAPPSPKRRALRHSGRQIQHKDPGPGGAGPQCGDAAGDDLVVGVRRQDKDSARPDHSRLTIMPGRPSRVPVHQAPSIIPAAACHTGSRSSVSTSRQVGTRAST
jgi:hypothetical protein